MSGLPFSAKASDIAAAGSTVTDTPAAGSVSIDTRAGLAADMAAADPAFAGALDNATLLQRLQHELAHPPFHALLKPQAVAVDAAAGTVVIRLPYDPSLRGAADMDFIHGGVIAALIDMAAHAAVAVQTGRMAPTVDLRIDYLRPAPGGDLIATARVLKLGRAIARADVEVGGAGTQPYAVGRGTFSTLVPAA